MIEKPKERGGKKIGLPLGDEVHSVPGNAGDVVSERVRPDDAAASVDVRSPFGIPFGTWRRSAGSSADVGVGVPDAA